MKGRILLSNKKIPISNVPEMLRGASQQMVEIFYFRMRKKMNFLKSEPQAEIIKPFMSAREFLHNQKRWCFWLVDANPNDLNACPNFLKRIEAVKQFRLKSTKAATSNGQKSHISLLKTGNQIRIIAYTRHYPKTEIIFLLDFLVLNLL